MEKFSHETIEISRNIFHISQGTKFLLCWILNLLATLFKYSDMMLVQWTKVYSAINGNRKTFIQVGI